MQCAEATGRFQAIDLTDCDREPIHIPGSIQPHGVLLGVSRQDFLVTAVSANLGPHCGATSASLLGKPLGSLIEPAGFDQIRTARPDPGQSVLIARLRLAGSAAPAWRAMLHGTETGFLLDAEQLAASADTDALDHFDRFHDALQTLQAAPTIDATCRSLVAEVRRLTGFSRVMLYRFAPDWCGEVIAEDSDGQMASYLGLHFPASDIPVQARALYTRNATRQIPDVSYSPVPVLHSSPGPVDLSASDLRSVSPIHLAYLRNMGVGAAMSVSLLRNGGLWGLVACHHPAAHHAAPEKIKSCLLLAQVAAARLALIEETELARRNGSFKSVETRLLQQAAMEEDQPGSLPQAALLRDNSQDLLDLLGATGLVLRTGGVTSTLGEVPPGAALDALLRWLAGHCPHQFISDHLAADYPDAADLRPAAGLLAVKLGALPDDFIIWLRPEVTRAVTWAGTPIKLVERRDGQDILTPRHSFAAWTEQLRGRSRAWTTSDIVAANSLRDTLMEIVARRAAQIERLNQQLLRSNEELESFAYIASHDLKEPLRQIEMYGTLLQRAFGRVGDPAEKIERWFAGISTSSHRLRSLIDHLAEYSRLGSEARVLGPAKISVLVAEVLQDFSGPVAAHGCTIEIGELPIVMCDAIQLRQVFQNLIGNAIKYRHPDRPLVLRITATKLQAKSADPAFIEFRVEDNGIGFETQHSEMIFRPFERLHSSEAYEGSGLGLAICRKIIDRHGGTIAASSRIGEGSVFTFTLPHRSAGDQEAHAA
jgi:light-regulated signal transduction histidine kinase (bacteriophytochrome)